MDGTVRDPTKTRYFGGWCSRKRTQYQASCPELLGLSVDAEADQQEADQSEECLESADSVGPAGPDDESSLECPACESRSLRLVSSTAKPSWSTVLTHFDARCPSWYAEQEHQELCEYLEREYGISYEDWCLEMWIESPMSEQANGTAGPPQQFHQLYLPGLSPVPSFAIESY